ncbi:hypothetical protein [Spiroplasma ixodetis]|uniref:Transposase n=1 Tax=Spiroplasma ixodetis TaxID=2141 RepID=A0ABN7BTU9_9MOLU
MFFKIWVSITLVSYKSKIKKKKEDLNEFQFYLIDSTEIEIERPTKKTTVRIFFW